MKKDPDMDNYYSAIEPFSIKFNSNNIAGLQSNLIGLDMGKSSISEITLENGLSLQIFKGSIQI